MAIIRRRCSQFRDDIRSRDLAEACSVVQIRNLAIAPNSIYSLFWVAVLVGSAVGFFYQSSLLFKEYKQHHVVTDVSVRLRFYSENL